MANTLTRTARGGTTAVNMGFALGTRVFRHTGRGWTIPLPSCACGERAHGLPPPVRDPFGREPRVLPTDRQRPDLLPWGQVMEMGLYAGVSAVNAKDPDSAIRSPCFHRLGETQ
jgi:hypothetical protein